jgi:hypothetical protein
MLVSLPLVFFWILRCLIYGMMLDQRPWKDRYLYMPCAFALHDKITRRRLFAARYPLCVHIPLGPETVVLGNALRSLPCCAAYQ